MENPQFWHFQFVYLRYKTGLCQQTVEINCVCASLPRPLITLSPPRFYAVRRRGGVCGGCEGYSATQVQAEKLAYKVFKVMHINAIVCIA